jgi:uridine kinase
MPVTRDQISQLAQSIAKAPLPQAVATRIVGVDGYGGAGKSTVARLIAAELNNSTIVPTDDFASWDGQFDWWPRMIQQVLKPLAFGLPARYQRYDWNLRQLSEWIDLPRLPSFVLIEGVGATRKEFDAYLCYRIWVDAPPRVRLQRGLVRDGEAMKGMWEHWMAAEEEHFRKDQPTGRADVIVSGVS